jgi:putative membrane protein
MKIFKYFSILTGILLLFSINVFAMHRFSPWHEGPGMMWGCGGLLIGLAFLVVIGLVIYFIVKNIREKKSDIVTKEETPLEILKRRYAKGEINQEEFKNMRKELQG